MPQAHGHTALHMAAGLHGNPHQKEILRLLLRKGADPSIRNLENDQPVHLLQSGEQGEQVSPHGRLFTEVYTVNNPPHSQPCLFNLAEADAEEARSFLSST